MTQRKHVKIHMGKTTPIADTKPERVKIDPRPIRLAENQAYLKNANVKAFLGAIAWAEGGGYDFMFGALPNSKKWRITDYSTHPGADLGGKTTAAGMYQITNDTWKDHGIKGMGLHDFGPDTQDLIAVSVLRRAGAVEDLVKGNFKKAMESASRPWAALSKGPGLPNRYQLQPYKTYEEVLAKYKELGGAEQ